MKTCTSEKHICRSHLTHTASLDKCSKFSLRNKSTTEKSRQTRKLDSVHEKILLVAYQFLYRLSCSFM